MVLASLIPKSSIQLNSEKSAKYFYEEELFHPLIKEEKLTTIDNYADTILLNIVYSLDEAIHHITQYGTKHSEAIVTNDYLRSERFLKEVDASSVYVNASTRFTDGEEFGFGAEIGISTQKLHARGPMGLPELTSYKYLIRGTGQVR